METKELIASIEHLAKDMAQLCEFHGIRHTSLMPSFMDKVDPLVFVEVCEHYGVQPSISEWPSAWIEKGCSNIYMTSDKVASLHSEKPKDTLAKLREAIEASAPTSAAQ